MSVAVLGGLGVEALGGADVVSLSKESVDWLARAVTAVTVLSVCARLIWKRRTRRMVKRFFGASRVTTCFPMRVLEGRRAIAEADFEAATLLSGFLAKHGVEVDFSFVSDEHGLSRTAPGLVMICGPKSSALVAEAVQRDPVLRLGEDGDAWSVTDLVSGEVFRSPRDVHGSRADIGYLARSGRSPGAGPGHLSIAGVHAEGSAVVVRHLCSVRTLRSLSKRASGKAFSAVFAGQYSERPFEVLKTEEVAFRRHDEQTGEGRGAFVVVDESENRVRRGEPDEDAETSPSGPDRPSGPGTEGGAGGVS